MAPRDPFGFTGALIDTQLRVEEPIGEGGFSIVYRGHHLGLDEPVAIKCLKLPPGLTSSMTESLVDRFKAESRISYRLSQGNLDIVRSISSGTVHSPVTGVLVPYIALEWLNGPSLSSELESRRAGGLAGRPLGEVLHLLDPAAMALDYAHKQGVIHRDVKPGNLLLVEVRDSSKRRIKVLDFGLAKIIDAEGTGLVPTAKTIAQMIICSPSYGAPEQFDSSVGPISAATDVYSFAMIVLEMLRDKKVRPAGSIGAAAKKAIDPNPCGPIALGIPVSRAIDALFLRALALDPSKRPKDLGDFWSELQRLSAMPVSQASDLPPLTSPLIHTAPAPIAPKPSLPRTTQPMKRPEPAAGPEHSLGDQRAQSPLQALMSTAIMPDRPKTPLPHELSGPKTASIRAADPGGSAAKPAILPSERPASRSRSLLSAKVIVLVVTLLILTSGVAVVGGYVAHRWMAARWGSAASQ
jgi:serine/threonine-protein kinase